MLNLSCRRMRRGSSDCGERPRSGAHNVSKEAVSDKAWGVEREKEAAPTNCRLRESGNIGRDSRRLIWSSWSST
jgi:hypothetical protein